MKTVSINRVDMNAICPMLLQQWAECYCQIWKEAPWNEDFWRPESVINDFKIEMRKPDATAFLAVSDGLVVGFTHGYSVDKAELRSIAGNSLLDGLFVKADKAFYVDELGVSAESRGKRISFDLTHALLDAVRASGLSVVVLRTDTKAYTARHVYAKLGFTELNVHDVAYPDRTYWSLDISQRDFVRSFSFGAHMP